MADTILVTPEELKNTAETFRGIGAEARNLTEQMKSLVDGLSSIFEGEEATAFNEKFHGLDDDMEMMHNNVTTQVNHLNEIADVFIQTQNGIRDDVSGLKTQTSVSQGQTSGVTGSF